ncbi:MAG: hypothetical protein M3O32_10245 [Actinomycetota bacterium]|nr:hypothetical protein [Actinomycetota bacterium]
MTAAPIRIGSTIVENVVLPIAVYLLLTAVGWQPVWALVGAAGTSVAVLVIAYVRTRELTTLGLLVLLRFVLDIVIAAVTGDPQLQLAKDFAITGVMGVVAAASVPTRRPLIARIRRDLAGRPDDFECTWSRDAGFRSLHRRMTVGWAIGLIGEAVVGIVLAHSLPLTAAVVATSVLSPATIFGLIVWTEYRARHWRGAHDSGSRYVGAPEPPSLPPAPRGG